MKKPEIARRLAHRSGVTPAEAADRLDGIISQILKKLRRGQAAPFPGFGEFKIGTDGRIKFQRAGKNEHAS